MGECSLLRLSQGSDRYPIVKTPLTKDSDETSRELSYDEIEDIISSFGDADLQDAPKQDSMGSSYTGPMDTSSAGFWGENKQEGR